MRLTLGSKRQWIGLLMGVIALFCLAIFFTDVQSEESRRYGLLTDRFDLLRSEILTYARNHDALPARIEDLPQPPKGKEWRDLWGNPLHYGVAGEIVTITMLGRDGKPGGTGEDQDAFGTFKLKTIAGRWEDPQHGGWEQYPNISWTAMRPTTAEAHKSGEGFATGAVK